MSKASWRLVIVLPFVVATILVGNGGPTAARTNGIPPTVTPTPRRGTLQPSGVTSLLNPSVFLPVVMNGASGTPRPATPAPSPTPTATEFPVPTPLPTVTGQPSYTFTAPPNPVNLTSVSIDSTRAITATLPVAGGSMTATGADGAIYYLVIPANALVQPTTITMTPILSVGGLPNTLRYVDGVQLHPDGLKLYQLATLSITPPSSTTVVNPYTFGTRESSLEVFGAPLQYPFNFSKTTLTMNLLHFTDYYLGDGYSIQVNNSIPTLTIDQLQNLASQIIEAERAWEQAGNAPNPNFLPLLQQVFTIYYNQVIISDLEGMQQNCTNLQALTPYVIGWEKQAQMFFGANNNPFDSSFTYITSQMTSAMLNCWNQTISPCVDWTNVTQAQTVVSMARQAAVMGLGDQINIDNVTPCGCTGVSQYTLGWNGTVTYSFSAQGQYTDPNLTTWSTNLQESFSAAGQLTNSNIGLSFPFPYVANNLVWDTGKFEPTGSAIINETDVETTSNPTSTTTTTVVGNGIPVASYALNPSTLRLALSPSTCLYSLTAVVYGQATYLTQPGGVSSTNPVEIGALYVPPQPLPPTNGTSTLSGTASVLVYANEGENTAVAPYEDPYVVYGSGDAFFGIIAQDTGQPDLGTATVTWSFTPITQ